MLFRSRTSLALVTARRSSQRVIADGVTIVTFARGKQPLDGAMVRIPFTQDFPGTVDFTVSFDLNGDGVFDASERGVGDVASVATTELPTAFPIVFRKSAVMRTFLRLSAQTPVPVRIVLDGVPGLGRVVRELPASRLIVDTSGALDTTPPGFVGGGRILSSWGAALGPTLIPSVHADGASIDITRHGVPDRGSCKGKMNECFPIAAAN